MHNIVRREIKRFIRKHPMQSARIAELGSLNINGSIRELLPPLTGFDIVKGKGVDVVINPGWIPVRYRNKFDNVFAANSFQYCKNPKIFKKQIVDLLKCRGIVWLNMCWPKCHRSHTTSKNEYAYTDTTRMTKAQLKEFMSPQIKCIRVYMTGTKEHKDIIYIGQKRS